MHTVFSLVEILVLVLPVLLSVAFITIIERKVLASFQRRVGPNTVGYYGVLQPFADALKLLLKENVIPTQSNTILFYVSPIVSLIFSLLNWCIIPFGSGLVLIDIHIGVLFSLAISSIGVYGILFAGWSANNSFTFIGSLRSTAQIISYELIFSSAIICVIFLSNSFNLIAIIECQKIIYNFVPLFPIFCIFLISILAETNRTPFDLAESESELVAGFFTEHSSTVFTLFFLSEYSSIVFISAFTAILFFGGYELTEVFTNTLYLFNLSSLVLFFKTSLILYFFVWIRATLPRIKYQDLISFCWSKILPLVIAFVLFVPSVLISFDLF